MADNKEPWNKKVYQNDKEERGQRGGKGAKTGSKKTASTRFLTFLVIGLFMIIGIIIATLLWSNQVTDNSKISNSFYTSDSSELVASSQQAPSTTVESSQAPAEEPQASSTAESQATPSSAQPAESTDTEVTSSSSEVASGNTTEVVAGEGINQIAARTGVPASQIAAANGMTVDSWFAYPGQVIKLK
ncbi:LysM peptidoglycan-binding domain-containing protein [Streptococcaceae bacterium ESL0729]|nr:LysM peptidoglycan-binding domain-containing protein [Streptococcaceae bacterium ESL0729]